MFFFVVEASLSKIWAKNIQVLSDESQVVIGLII